MKSKDKFIEDLLKIKRARLIEHNMSYEDLMMIDNFSEDEKSYEYVKNRARDMENIKAIKKTKKLKVQIQSLKEFSIECMKEILNTIYTLDKSTRQMLITQFDVLNANPMARSEPILSLKFRKMLRETNHPYEEVDTDDLESESSGNNSDFDDINTVTRLKQEALE